VDVRALFEDELRRRGLSFTIEPDSGRHAIEAGGGRLLVSLDNLQRDVATDGDLDRIDRFVDAIEASSRQSERSLSAERLYWSLEPNDYADTPSFRSAISNRIDRVLVHLSENGQLITWLEPHMLEQLGLSETAAARQASANLSDALAEASLQKEDIDGVPLGSVGTELPFKSSLILAPNLREVAGPALGWPLMAVAPDRDFLYMWPAEHAEFVQRVGGVVVREYSQAAYRLSTEVYRIDDEGIRAIGEFPHD
jgi:hypothetical protein